MRSPLTTLDYVKDFLQIDGDSGGSEGSAPGPWDVYLTNRIASVSDAVENYCRRVFGLETYNEVLDGPGSTELLLLHSPVQSITSLTLNTNSPLPTYIPVSDIICNKRTGIISINPYSTAWAWFNYQPQSISVVYVAGFTEIPLAIQDIVAEAVGLLYSKLGQDLSKAQEKIGDYSYTNRPDVQQLLTEDMKKTLRKWREQIV